MTIFNINLKEKEIITRIAKADIGIKAKTRETNHLYLLKEDFITQDAL